jgi:hypothetical protein
MFKQRIAHCAALHPSSRARAAHLHAARRTAHCALCVLWVVVWLPVSKPLSPVPRPSLCAQSFPDRNKSARTRCTLALRHVPCRTCALPRRAPRRARVASFYVFCLFYAADTLIHPPTSRPRARAQLPSAEPKQRCSRAHVASRAIPHVRAPSPRAAPRARRVILCILCILSVLCS